MNGKKICYALLQNDFFSDGLNGRVSHAIGFSKGLADNNNHVSVLCGIGVDKFIQTNQKISLKVFDCAPFIWVYLLFCSRSFDSVIIRWRPFFGIFFYFHGLIYKNIVFEVNSLTSLNARYSLFKSLALIDFYLLANYFKLIFNSVRNQARFISHLGQPSADHVRSTVLPNGFDAQTFKKIDFSFENKVINLIYFGTYQPYYDWKYLFSEVDKFPTEFADCVLNLYGINGKDSKSIIYRGAFTPTQLISDLSALKSQVLILHNDSSAMSVSGSPMKLFEYCATGLPVFVSRNVTHLVENFPVVKYFDTNIEGDLTRALIQFFGTGEASLHDSGCNSLHAVNNMSWKALINKFDI